MEHAVSGPDRYPPAGSPAWIQASAAGPRDEVFSILDSLPGPAFLKDVHSVYSSANREFSRAVGFPREQLAGKTDFDLFPKELAEALLREDRRILSGEAPQLETEHVLDTGSGPALIRIRKLPVRDAEGRITGVAGIASGPARDGAQKFQKLAAAVSEGVLATDAQFRVVFANARLAGMLGNPPAGIAGRSLLSLLPETSRGDLAAEMEQWRRGEAGTCELHLPAGAGNGLTVRFSATPFAGENGEFDGVLGTVVDISGEKRREGICPADAPGPDHAEVLLARERRLIEAIRQVQMSPLGDTDVDSFCGEILRILAEASQSPAGFLKRYLHGPDGSPGTAGLTVHGPIPVPDGVETALDELLSASAGAEGRVAIDPVAGSWMAVPLFANQELVGAAALANRPGGYDGGHAAYLAPLLNSLGRSLQILRAREIERECLEAVRVSERKWRAYIGKSPMAIFLADERGRYLEVNRAACKLTGYSEAKLLGASIFDLCPPEALESNRLHFEQVLRNGHSEGIGRMLRGDGEFRDCAVVAVQVAENRFLAFCHDITDSVQTAKAREISERRLRRALEGSSDGWWEYDARTREVFASPRCYTMLEYSPDEFPMDANSCVSLFHPEERGAIWEETRRQLASGDSLVLEGRVKTKHGNWVWVAIRGKVVERDGTGKVLHLAGTSSDITARKRAELASRESEERYRTIIEHNPQFVLLAREGRYVYANPVTLAALGCRDASDMVNRPLSDFIHPSQRQAIMERSHAALGGKSNEPMELRVVRADGSELVLESVSVPIRLEDGPAVLVMGVDVTERKRMDDSLRASLAEKEVLLREVHHRVKNNLAAIIGLLALQRRALRDSGADRALTELAGRIQSMVLVHEKLYRSDNMARIDFADYLRSLVAGLRTTYSVPETVLCRVDANLKLALDFAIPCGMIVNELVTNSMKYAFPAGAGRSCVQGEIAIEAGEEGPACRIAVSDNGVGLPSGFDWSTAETLGMRLVRMLAQHQLGGQIRVESSAGTRVEIRFTPAGRN